MPAIVFLAAVVVPVFFGSIRSAPFWLAVQASALAWNVGALGEPSLHTAAALAEVLVLRGFLAAQVVGRTIRKRGEPNVDLMPSNLFTWAIGIALVALAFEYAAPAMTDRHALALGVVGATVAVSLLLLSTNESPPAQLVAVLFMENGLALFESLLPERWPLPVHLTLTAVYVLTVAVGGWLLATPDQVATARDGRS